MSRKKITKYDIALSFTEKDSAIAQKMARELRKKGFSVYFYKNINQLGEDLSSIIQTVYGNRSNYGLVILSEEYKQKSWTMKEWKTLQKAKNKRNIKKVFVVMVNGRHHLPGLKETAIHYKWKNDPKDLAKKIKENVGSPPVRTLRFIIVFLVILLITLGLYYSITLNIL